MGALGLVVAAPRGLGNQRGINLGQRKQIRPCLDRRCLDKAWLGRISRARRRCKGDAVVFLLEFGGSGSIFANRFYSKVSAFMSHGWFCHPLRPMKRAVAHES